MARKRAGEQALSQPGEDGRAGMRTKLHTLARERFGVRVFRPGQLELIEAVLAGKDAIGVLPTGAGKSLTYQLPALLLEGPVVVVSPLIALMQDQQEKLAEREIPAAKVNSTLRVSEEREIVAEIERGHEDLIYITPERLENAEYLDLLKRQRVSLFVVDEAHCVSQWGHDFRPAYLALRDAARELDRPPVLALTATATPDVIEDIEKQLAMRSPVVVHTGVERKNLLWEVQRAPRAGQKREALLRLLRETNGIGIIYVATVRAANELHAWLVEQGINAGIYHGKLKTSEREETQRHFMNDELSVMVATNAFGLGIDKPNVRFIVHYHFPDSLESYYQEAGRAGRDGKPARICLLYRLEDKRVQSFFLGGKYPRREESRHLIEILEAHGKQGGGALRASELAERAGVPVRRVKVVLAQLEGAGIVQRTRDRARLVRELADPDEWERLLGAYEERHQNDRDRLDTMMRYAQSKLCRTRYLQQYFGEEVDVDCGHCDNCAARAHGEKEPTEEKAPSRITSSAASPHELDSKHLERLVASAVGSADPAQLKGYVEKRAVRGEDEPAPPQPLPFHKGQRVRHASFGQGEVLTVEHDRVEVDFVGQGVKSLDPHYLEASR